VKDKKALNQMEGPIIRIPNRTKSHSGAPFSPTDELSSDTHDEEEETSTGSLFSVQ
jgi:hypothetical protein